MHRGKSFQCDGEAVYVFLTMTDPRRTLCERCKRLKFNGRRRWQRKGPQHENFDFSLAKTPDQLRESGINGCSLCRFFSNKLAGRRDELITDERYRSSIVSLHWDQTGGEIQDLFITCTSAEGEVPYDSGVWELYTKNGELVRVPAKRKDSLQLLTILR